MALKHTTSSGREVWICETCRKRRKSESACRNHELTCRGRPKPKVNDYSNASFKTKKRPGTGFTCCIDGQNHKSVLVIGNHHICRPCFDKKAKETGGVINLNEYPTYI